MASGLPEVDSLSTYGGVRADYSPIEDSSTDVSAAAFNLIAANVAAMTQTIPRAIYRFVGKASSPPDDAASNVHFNVWGNGVSVKAVSARTGTGVFTLTYPTTVTDENGVVHTVNFVDGWANVNGSTPYDVLVTCAVNVVTIRVFNTAGAANDAVGSTIAIYLR